MKETIVHVQVSGVPALLPEQSADSGLLIPEDGVVGPAGFFGVLQQIGYDDGVGAEAFERGLKERNLEEGAWLS